MVSQASSLPGATSAAVNIQIFEPKNFPNGASPGTINNGGVNNAFGGPANPYAMNGQNAQYGAGGPQANLQNAYQQAVDARNAAEQARNAYLSLANQANGNAYQQQQQQPSYYPQPYLPQQQQQAYNPYQQAPVNQNVYNNVQPQNPYAQYPQQYPQAYPQQYPQQQQFPQQQVQPGQPPVAPEQPPVDQVQPQPEVPQADPFANQPPQQPDPSGLTTDQLNAVIANPQTLQEKVDAMEEVGVRGQGTPETYELLKQEALADTSQLTGQAQDDANYIRQAALWTLGMLNKSQNANAPTKQLPGLDVISNIINNKNENADVKAAAVQSLQVINRPKDREIKKILKKAKRDKNPDVKRLANEALAGKGIPLPGAGADGGQLALMA